MTSRTPLRPLPFVAGAADETPAIIVPILTATPAEAVARAREAAACESADLLEWRDRKSVV